MVNLPDLIPQAEYLDTGYYRIPTAVVKHLCDGVLPRYGYEKRVTHAGYRFWIARTPHLGKQVWSVRFADKAVSWRPNPLRPGTEQAYLEPVPIERSDQL